jgi:membrane fusion protein, multidrug efflux system
MPAPFNSANAPTARTANRGRNSTARASLEASRRQTDVIKAQQQAAAAVVAADQAQLEQARLNLSYTKIPAPVDGMIAVRSVEVGNKVSPGATLMTVVPLAQVYIIANYREVDLRHVRAGQNVTIHLDAYNIDLDGTVNGIGAASGVSFSPIQPNNATGKLHQNRAAATGEDRRESQPAPWPSSCASASRSRRQSTPRWKT